jgi:hypothetical protein
MAHSWPNISKSEVTRFTKTDRPNGYDIDMALRSERTNHTTMEFEAKAALTNHPWGVEWTADLVIRGAVVLNSDQLPAHVTTKIIYGETVGDMRSNTVVMTTRYQSGRSSTEKNVQLMPARLPDLSAEEYLQGFNRIFNGEPFDQIFLGEEPKGEADSEVE